MKECRRSEVALYLREELSLPKTCPRWSGTTGGQIVGDWNLDGADVDAGHPCQSRGVGHREPYIVTAAGCAPAAIETSPGRCFHFAPLSSIQKIVALVGTGQTSVRRRFWESFFSRPPAAR